MSMQGEVKGGTYTGNGAALTVRTGFVPDKLEIVNLTDGIHYIWFKGMAAANVIQQAANGATTTVSSNGITAVAGTRPSHGGSVGAETFVPGAEAGFTLGTAVRVNTKVYYWTAYRYSA